MMNDSNIQQWFIAAIALLLLIMPVLLADKLSLLASWLFTYVCWLAIIVFALFHSSTKSSDNNKSKEP